jgi:hypothetical protein
MSTRGLLKYCKKPQPFFLVSPLLLPCPVTDLPGKPWLTVSIREDPVSVLQLSLSKRDDLLFNPHYSLDYLLQG